LSLQDVSIIHRVSNKKTLTYQISNALPHPINGDYTTLSG